MKHSYLLNFIAGASLCMISTIMNGALPPAPEMEVQRKAINFEIGLIALRNGLSPEAMNSIQNFVAPEERTLALKLNDTYYDGHIIDSYAYTITFVKNRKTIAGSTICWYGLGGGPREKTICIPVDEPLTVQIATPMRISDGSYYSVIRTRLLLEPRQLRSIKAISVDPEFARITYTDSPAEDKIRL